MTRSLLDVYDRRAAQSGDELALQFPAADRTHYTWADLARRSSEHATRLDQAGVPRGAHVAVGCSAGFECLAWFLAVWRHRGVVVAIDPQWGPWLRDQVISHSRAAALVESESSELVEVDRTVCHRRNPSNDLAFLSYTSGTTGQPKGVMLGHGQLLHAYRSGGTELARLAGRRPSALGCVMRGSGLGVLGHTFLWAAVLGARVVTLPELSAHNAAAMWPALAEHDVDACYLVPPLVSLLARATRAGGRPASTVFMTGGAPLGRRLRAEFEDRFGTRLLNFYGLTEVGFTAFFGGVDDGADHDHASVGLPGTVLARLRDEGGEVVLDPDGVGELEIVGPSLAFGYFEDATGWQECLRTGWFATGDIAERDLQGNYRIVGRQKDAVMQGGFTIYLGEVESAAQSIPEVVEAAAGRVVGRDQLERVGLVVRLQPGADLEKVRRQVIALLGVARAPGLVVETDRPLPRIGQGKVDRRLLGGLLVPDGPRRLAGRST